MLCQANAPEPAAITDDVTFSTLCWQTDNCIENIVYPLVSSQNNVGFIVQVMMHRWYQKLRHCWSVHYYAISTINDVVKYCAIVGYILMENVIFLRLFGRKLSCIRPQGNKAI